MVDQDPFLVPQVFNIIFFVVPFPLFPSPLPGSTWTKKKKKKVVADAPSPWGGGAYPRLRLSVSPPTGLPGAPPCDSTPASGPDANTIFLTSVRKPATPEGYVFQVFHTRRTAHRWRCISSTLQKQTPKQNPGATATFLKWEPKKSKFWAFLGFIPRVFLLPEMAFAFFFLQWRVQSRRIYTNVWVFLFFTFLRLLFIALAIGTNVLGIFLVTLLRDVFLACFHTLFSVL